MNYKKIGKALLYPPLFVMLLLLPVAILLLVLAMTAWGSASVPSVIAYVLSAYTLTVWCFKIPYLVRFFKAFKSENKYARRWLADERLRVNVSLYASLAMNALYAAFQLWLGISHHTFWYYSFAVYYLCLAVMRFFLLRHTRTHRAGEKMRTELLKYRACGWVFLAMNLALALIVFFMVYWDRTFVHHQITTIMMAAYTFTALTLAIVSIVKYRKYNSPIYAASKTVSLTAAAVSMLTLETTMLTAFGDGTMDRAAQKLMLALTGAAVVAFVVVMAIYMIVQGSKKLKLLEEEENGRK